MNVANIIPCLHIALPPQLLFVDVQLPFAVCITDRGKGLSCVSSLLVLCCNTTRVVLFIFVILTLSRQARCNCNEHVTFNSGGKDTKENVVDVLSCMGEAI